MDLNCPKCSSEQTQKITAIVSSGTTHSVGRTNSVGVASVGGKMAIGSSSGTTHSTSTSALAKKLAAPTRQSDSLILPFIFVVVLVGWIPVAIMGFFGVLVSGGLGYWLFQRMKTKADAAKQYNSEVYPGAIAAWENSFYCHRCEHSFIPALT